ncbi:hypothetical protein V2J09_017641 [Rumex salicifolius]
MSMVDDSDLESTRPRFGEVGECGEQVRELGCEHSMLGNKAASAADDSSELMILFSVVVFMMNRLNLGLHEFWVRIGVKVMARIIIRVALLLASRIERAGSTCLVPSMLSPHCCSIVRNTSLFGAILEELVGLKELEVLDLGFNNLKGNLPNEWETMLEFCKFCFDIDNYFAFENR